jgi:2'-hydroxyisoflavone reductase
VKLLVLGGTVFVGRHLVEAALARGHEVTLFHRGLHGADLFPEAERVLGDRHADLGRLAGRTWDAAIDTSALFPSAVTASARALAGAVDRYALLSSVMAYRDRSRAGLREDDPTARLDDAQLAALERDPPPHGAASPSGYRDYGALKAHCEAALAHELGDRALVVRAGVLVGPGDPSERLARWPRRIAAGGEVLAPGDPSRIVKVLDVRDLASWLLDLVEARAHGVLNAAGPPRTMQEILHACRAEVASGATFTWVDDDFLLEHQIKPFFDFSLWIPERDPFVWGVFRLDDAAARAAGLGARPLAETVRDTMLAERGRAPATAGLDPAREAALLAEWRRRQSRVA